jgi:hypothetical protein
VGLFGGLVKAGVAKKVYDEARKPQNQARIKSLVGKVMDKRGGGRGDSGGRSTRRLG